MHTMGQKTRLDETTPHLCSDMPSHKFCAFYERNTTRWRLDPKTVSSILRKLICQPGTGVSMTKIQVEDAAGVSSAVCLAAGAPGVCVAMCVANCHFAKHGGN